MSAGRTPRVHRPPLISSAIARLTRSGWIWGALPCLLGILASARTFRRSASRPSNVKAIRRQNVKSGAASFGYDTLLRRQCRRSSRFPQVMTFAEASNDVVWSVVGTKRRMSCCGTKKAKPPSHFGLSRMTLQQCRKRRVVSCGLRSILNSGGSSDSFQICEAQKQDTILELERQIAATELGAKTPPKLFQVISELGSGETVVLLDGVGRAASGSRKCMVRTGSTNLLYTGCLRQAVRLLSRHASRE